MAATLPLREALNESISSGRLEDTKIILYSRRDSSGSVCRPRALYASSHVLKTVPYFSDQADLKDFSEVTDDSESAEDYGYYSDSDLEEDDDHVVSSGEQPKKTAPLGGYPLDPFCSSLGDEKSTHTYGERKEPPEKGKVIKIQDVAFITFQAFLFYLYTGYIEFAPYGSEENRKSRVAEIRSVSGDSIPRPSPKSIYRLADKYDVPSLKGFALDNIRNGLGRCDIVEEAFSEFASKYQEVRTVQVIHLASVWFRGGEESAERLGERIDEKVDSYANGELDHAMEAMTFLWELSRKGDESSVPSPIPVLEATPPVSRSPSLATPSDAGASVCASPLSLFSPPIHFSHRKTPVFGPANRRPVEIALIKSIREGTFFDRKYWARHSKLATPLRPLYISSVVVGEKLAHINNLVKPHRGDGGLDTGSGSEDSDYEGSLEQAGETKPTARADGREESEREPLPVLTVGSFAGWRSLFFYLCTGVIQFAPLKSRGADVRAQYIQEEATPDKPPPCSPKVIYSLASTLDIKPLRDLAFNDISSKITSANIAAELFSGFTSRESDIMKMHCGLLDEKFHEKSTTTSAADLIKSMAGGDAAHRAGALKLALRNGRLRGGVPPRCPDPPDCDFHYDAISYYD